MSSSSDEVEIAVASDKKSPHSSPAASPKPKKKHKKKKKDRIKRSASSPQLHESSEQEPAPVPSASSDDEQPIQPHSQRDQRQRRRRRASSTTSRRRNSASDNGSCFSFKNVKHCVGLLFSDDNEKLIAKDKTTLFGSLEQKQAERATLKKTSEEYILIEGLMRLSPPLIIALDSATRLADVEPYIPQLANTLVGTAAIIGSLGIRLLEKGENSLHFWFGLLSGIGMLAAGLIGLAFSLGLAFGIDDNESKAADGFNVVIELCTLSAAGIVFIANHIYQALSIKNKLEELRRKDDEIDDIKLSLP